MDFKSPVHSVNPPPPSFPVHWGLEAGDCRGERGGGGGDWNTGVQGTEGTQGCMAPTAPRKRGEGKVAKIAGSIAPLSKNIHIPV